MDIGYFFSRFKRQFFELNRFSKEVKFKKTFFKSDGGHAISLQEERRLPKCTAWFPAKKIWHSPPRRVALGLPSPSPSVCTDVRTYWLTLTSQPKFLASMGYQIFLSMVLR